MSGRSVKLESLDLPPVVSACYAGAGIQELFPWQADWLTQPGVLQGRNLVYAAPTSAG